MYRLLLVAALAASPIACDSDDDDDVQTASATLSAPADTTTSVTGTVQFSQDGDQLRMRVDLRGVPAGQHGFHIYEVGSCARGDHDADGRVQTTTTTRVARSAARARSRAARSCSTATATTSRATPAACRATGSAAT